MASQEPPIRGVGGEPLVAVNTLGLLCRAPPLPVCRARLQHGHGASIGSRKYLSCATSRIKLVRRVIQAPTSSAARVYPDVGELPTTPDQTMPDLEPPRARRGTLNWGAMQNAAARLLTHLAFDLVQAALCERYEGFEVADAMPVHLYHARLIPLNRVWVDADRLRHFSLTRVDGQPKVFDLGWSHWSCITERADALFRPSIGLCWYACRK